MTGRAALALAVVAATLAPAAGAPVTTATKVAGASIDWTRGVVVARGIGPADRHAPSPAVARVGARRAAEDQARARLAQVVRTLPVAGGGTVAEAAVGAALARLERELARAPVAAVVLGTDGSARVEIALGLEAVRQALAGPRPLAPGRDQPDASTLVVDARATRLAPAIGLSLRAGGAGWDGAVIFVRGDGDVPIRPGPRVRAKATAARAGTVSIDGSVPAAGALLVVLLPEKP